jgi:hypothetical protein
MYRMWPTWRLTWYWANSVLLNFEIAAFGHAFSLATETRSRSASQGVKCRNTYEVQQHICGFWDHAPEAFVGVVLLAAGLTYFWKNSRFHAG